MKVYLVYEIYNPVPEIFFNRSNAEIVAKKWNAEVHEHYTVDDYKEEKE